jgi:hypothetical protein
MGQMSLLCLAFDADRSGIEVPCDDRAAVRTGATSAELSCKLVRGIAVADLDHELAPRCPPKDESWLTIRRFIITRSGQRRWTSRGGQLYVAMWLGIGPRNSSPNAGSEKSVAEKAPSLQSFPSGVSFSDPRREVSAI